MKQGSATDNAHVHAQDKISHSTFTASTPILDKHLVAHTKSMCICLLLFQTHQDNEFFGILRRYSLTYLIKKNFVRGGTNLSRFSALLHGISEYMSSGNKDSAELKINLCAGVSANAIKSNVTSI